MSEWSSPTIGAIAAALAEAQVEIGDAVFDAVNPHFRSRYASLSAVFAAVRPVLARHGLGVTQIVEDGCAEDGWWKEESRRCKNSDEDGREEDRSAVQIRTVLVHSSGEWLASVARWIARDASPQAVGSAITYGRRYALSAICGIAADADDDAEAAQPAPQKAAPQKAAPAKAAPAKAAPETSQDEREQAAIRTEIKQLAERLWSPEQAREGFDALLTALSLPPTGRDYRQQVAVRNELRRRLGEVQ